MRKLKDIMNRAVVTLSPDMTLAEAAARLERHEITGAPVVQAGRVVGVLTTTDLRGVYGDDWNNPTHIGPVDAPLGDPTKIRVAERMTQSIISLPPEADRAEAASVMLQYGVHRVLVMDGPFLLGIVTPLDVVASQ